MSTHKINGINIQIVAGQVRQIDQRELQDQILTTIHLKSFDFAILEPYLAATDYFLFDTKGTIKAGSNTIKTLSWYENLGHAARLLDVARLYSSMDRQEEAA